jgi:hypothetical protein
VKLVDTLPASAQGQVVTLAQHTGSTALDSQIGRISNALIATIDDAKASDADRIAAAERLVQLRPADAAVVDLVMQRVGGKVEPRDLRRAHCRLGSLIGGRGSSGDPRSAGVVHAAGTGGGCADDPRQPRLGGHARGAARKRQVNLGDIPIVERTKLTEHPDRKIRDRAKKISGGWVVACRMPIARK